MFQNFLMKKMLKSKMQGVPEAEQQKIFDAIDKNPQFFQEIAATVQAKMAEGKDQMTAVMEVMQARQDELKKLVG